MRSLGPSTANSRAHTARSLFRPLGPACRDPSVAEARPPPARTRSARRRALLSAADGRCAICAARTGSPRRSVAPGAAGAARPDRGSSGRCRVARSPPTPLATAVLPAPRLAPTLPLPAPADAVTPRPPTPPLHTPACHPSLRRSHPIHTHWSHLPPRSTPLWPRGTPYSSLHGPRRPLSCQFAHPHRRHTRPGPPPPPPRAQHPPCHSHGKPQATTDDMARLGATLRLPAHPPACRDTLEPAPPGHTRRDALSTRYWVYRRQHRVVETVPERLFHVKQSTTRSRQSPMHRRFPTNPSTVCVERVRAPGLSGFGLRPGLQQQPSNSGQVSLIGVADHHTSTPAALGNLDPGRQALLQEPLDLERPNGLGS